MPDTWMVQCTQQIQLIIWLPDQSVDHCGIVNVIDFATER